MTPSPKKWNWLPPIKILDFFLWHSGCLTELLLWAFSSDRMIHWFMAKRNRGGGGQIEKYFFLTNHDLVTVEISVVLFLIPIVFAGILFFPLHFYRNTKKQIQHPYFEEIFGRFRFLIWGTWNFNWVLPFVWYSQKMPFNFTLKKIVLKQNNFFTSFPCQKYSFKWSPPPLWKILVSVHLSQACLLLNCMLAIHQYLSKVLIRVFIDWKASWLLGCSLMY